MKKKIQINVVGKETTEKITAYKDLIRCNICVDGRMCAFWTTEANYKSLLHDGFFIRDGKSADITGIANTTNIFVEEGT